MAAQILQTKFPKKISFLLCAVSTQDIFIHTLIRNTNVLVRAAQSGGLGGLVRHRPILTGQKISGRFY